MTIPEQVEASVQKANKGFFEQLTTAIKEILTAKPPEAKQTETEKKPDAKTEPEKKEVADPAARVLALEKELATIRGELTQAQTDLTAANGKVTELEAKEQDISKRANAQFQAQCRKQGIPVGTIPDGNDANAPGSKTVSLLEQYNGITDPIAKGEFWAKNKAAMGY